MFKSKSHHINIKAAPTSSPLTKPSPKEIYHQSKSEADSILEELIRAARARQHYLKQKKIRLGIVKLEEQPLNVIKIEDSDDEEQVEEGHVFDLNKNRDQLRIRKGVINVKIAGKSKSKKIIKHNYFSDQDTLDKYVSHQVQSRHVRPVVKGRPASQSTLDMFFGQINNRQMSRNY